ncbi:hypothetical protein AC623_07225 [Bacillus sp. FJAT-27231]|uniref:hypothetical protein n=1 Tax=Bacillus sp. FJAT-27231 TaxID=1679168 RepID=UPI000670EB30|nr:hypothetical protein [Bacillus sp. FJAT-27231]KMY53789.1 hypothetical protein AC623_07225 [Bacillus sp. FJAT-27231]
MKFSGKFLIKLMLLSSYLVGGSAFFILILSKGIITLTSPLYLLGIFLFVYGWVWLARTYLSKQKDGNKQLTQHKIIH